MARVGTSPHALQRLGLPYVVAIRSNHSVWTFPGERVRQTRWRPFARIFTDGTTEQRYRCEFVFGKRTRTRYFVVTTDPVHLPPETTWRLMTNLPGNIEQTVGNTFGLRTWIEYGFKQAKDELGWADYRLTDAHSIERWWELVMCAYLLVSLQAPALAVAPAGSTRRLLRTAPAAASQHPAWTNDASWKHRLTNLRVFLQPFVCACLLLPWLRIHPLPHLAAGPRRPLRPHEYLPPAVPNLTDEGTRGSARSPGPSRSTRALRSPGPTRPL